MSTKYINAINDSMGIRNILSTVSPLKLFGLFFIPITLNRDMKRETMNNSPNIKNTNPTMSLLLILLIIVA